MAVRAELTRGLICELRKLVSDCSGELRVLEMGGKADWKGRTGGTYGVVNHPLDGHQDLQRNGHGWRWRRLWNEQ